MKVVILCGGMGTRLREETEYKPKPMVEIGGRPILWHIMKSYASYGFNEFVLCLGYKQSAIRDYFLNYRGMNNDFTIELAAHDRIAYHSSHNEDWTVSLVDTGAITKKGTRIKMIEPYIDGEKFMITYGDGLSDINFKKLLEFHHFHNKTVTFTGVHPISRFATVETNTKGEIVDWNEKKQLEGYINAGFFVADRKLFEYLGEDCELEEEPLKKLAKEDQLRMYRHDGFWQCMDTYRDATHLNELWTKNTAPWKIW